MWLNQYKKLKEHPVFQAWERGEEIQAFVWVCTDPGSMGSLEWVQASKMCACKTQVRVGVDNHGWADPLKQMRAAAWKADTQGNGSQSR